MLGSPSPASWQGCHTQIVVATMVGICECIKVDRKKASDQNLLPGAIVGGSDAHSFADHKDNSEQFDPLHITQCPDSWRSTMKKAIANIQDL
ncbi:hypothetical protein Tco_0212514, partial [Tanacetum coccineum]